MTQRKAILIGLILVLLSFQVLVLVILALFPYAPDPGLSSLNNHIYTFLAPLSTIFLLGLLYAWLTKLGIREARHYSRRSERLIQFYSEPFRALVSSIKTRPISDSARSFKIVSHPRILLAAILGATLPCTTWDESRTAGRRRLRTIRSGIFQRTLRAAPGNQFRQPIRFLDELLLSRI